MKRNSPGCNCCEPCKRDFGFCRITGTFSLPGGGTITVSAPVNFATAVWNQSTYVVNSSMVGTPSGRGLPAGTYRQCLTSVSRDDTGLPIVHCLPEEVLTKAMTPVLSCTCNFATCPGAWGTQVETVTQNASFVARIRRGIINSSGGSIGIVHYTDLSTGQTYCGVLFSLSCNYRESFGIDGSITGSWERTCPNFVDTGTSTQNYSSPSLACPVIGTVSPKSGSLFSNVSKPFDGSNWETISTDCQVSGPRFINPISTAITEFPCNFGGRCTIIETASGLDPSAGITPIVVPVVWSVTPC